MTTNGAGEKQYNNQNGKYAEIKQDPDDRQKRNLIMILQTHQSIQEEPPSKATESAG